jgi:hypothetical protein
MKLSNMFSQRNRDFKRVFLGTEEGKRVLAHLYKMCGMNKQLYSPGDPYEGHVNMGKHRVGQGIQSILAQDEQDILEMIKMLDKSKDEPNTIDLFDPFNKTKGDSDV